MRKSLYLHSFRVKAESPIALKVKDNIQFFTLFLVSSHVRVRTNLSYITHNTSGAIIYFRCYNITKNDVTIICDVASPA